MSPPPGTPERVKGSALFKKLLLVNPSSCGENRGEGRQRDGIDGARSQPEPPRRSHAPDPASPPWTPCCPCPCSWARRSRPTCAWVPLHGEDGQRVALASCARSGSSRSGRGAERRQSSLVRVVDDSRGWSKSNSGPGWKRSGHRSRTLQLSTLERGFAVSSSFTRKMERRAMQDGKFRVIRCKFAAAPSTLRVAARQARF